MGYKIFISYKYGDTNVFPFGERTILGYTPTKVRDYVTKMQALLEKHHHINKGEADGESLENFKDSTIASKLRDKIFDSSVTIVTISPGMKEWGVLERNQWIPWEISYSLCEYGRNGRTSHSNAMLAVVLPDFNGNYSYFINNISMSFNTYNDNLFRILRKNMFNKKVQFILHEYDKKTYPSDSSYVQCVKWIDFIRDPNSYINRAMRIRENINDYNICKTV